MNTKELAKKLIDDLPDEATLDDIIHALYVRVKHEHGENDIRQGRAVSHEEAKKRLQKWLK